MKKLPQEIVDDLMNDQDFLSLDEASQDEMLNQIQKKMGISQPSENILQKSIKAASSAFNTMPQPDSSHPFMSGMNAVRGGMKMTPGLGPYLGTHDFKSNLISEVNPSHPIQNIGIDILSDPEGLVNPGSSINTLKGIAKAPGALGKGIGNIAKNVSGRVGEIWNSPKFASQIGSKMAGIEGDIAGLESKSAMKTFPKRGERILNEAQSNILSEFESNAKELSGKSRNVFVEHVPEMKDKFNKLTKDTYSKYGKLLKKGEEEAMSNGMDADLYREEVISPVLKTIEQTGAKTPSAEKLKRLFTVKEGLADSALEKADDEVLRNFDSLSSIEKMKALRSSLFKPGSEDFIQNMFSDLHGKFVGKFSPTVAKANQSYGPMKSALRWGSKNIKPFNEQEISRVADILQKERIGGKGNETIQAYLNTLKKGKGEFKGADLSKLSDSHKATLDAIETEINTNKAMIERLKSGHSEDIANIRKSSQEDILGDRNMLQQLASKKSEKAQLKVLQDKVSRDVGIRDNLIKYGIISGLGTIGLGGIAKIASRSGVMN